jgi:hypothetical protein
VRFFKRKPVGHRAAVFRVPRAGIDPLSVVALDWLHQAKPIPDERSEPEPYFVAICNCDWMGDSRESSEEAFTDAYAHTPNVDHEVRQPVGA